MTNRIYKLGLEEKGQDFKTLYVQGGVIIHVEPPIGRVWCGKELSAVDFAPNDHLSLKDGPLLTYGVEKVDIYDAKISYEDWLAEKGETGIACRASWGQTYLSETGLMGAFSRDVLQQELRS